MHSSTSQDLQQFAYSLNKGKKSGLEALSQGAPRILYGIETASKQYCATLSIKIQSWTYN
jgi:hypothetical protein